MILSNDFLNALFEFVGAIAVWMNIWVYAKDRSVKGVYWPMSIFYCLWGGFNLWYYPSLNQWFSFYAGILVFVGNFIWLIWVLFDIYKDRYISYLCYFNIHLKTAHLDLGNYKCVYCKKLFYYH